MAFFLPKPKDQGGAGALIPSSDVCKYKILEPRRQMLEKETVAEGKSYSTNRVTVNIAVNSLVYDTCGEMNDAWDQQVSSGYPSWVIRKG